MERSIWENILHSLDDPGTAQGSGLSEAQKAEISRKNAELTKKLRDAQGLKDSDLRWKPLKTKK